MRTHFNTDALRGAGCGVRGAVRVGRAHRTPAEPALFWHMATRSSISAFEAIVSRDANEGGSSKK